MDWDSDASSELTELSDDYTTGPPKRLGGKNEYKPKGMLKAPYTGTYSTDSVYTWIHTGSVELEPDYQRGVVWNEQKQSKLIDSLMRNFYVPPVIFRNIEDPETNEVIKRVCIDGKQRLTSLQQFMDGLIPHVDSDTKKKYWFKNVPSADGKTTKRTLLPTYLQSKFRQIQLVCIEYYGLNPSQEREIFQRVQLGMPLQPAERYAAHIGPWPQFVHDLKGDYFPDKGGLSEYIVLDTRRAKDFQLVSQVLMGIDYLPKHCSFAGTSLEKWLLRTDPPTESFKKKIRATLDRYIEVAATFSNTRVSPLEFVMIAMLVHSQSGIGLAQLSQYIAEFRTKLKAAHRDLRLNTACLKTAYKIIEEQLGGKTASKRKKRADDSEDEDESYRGTPIHSTNGRPAKRQSSRMPAAAGSSKSPSVPRVASAASTPNVKSKSKTATPRQPSSSSSTAVDSRPSTARPPSINTSQRPTAPPAVMPTTPSATPTDPIARLRQYVTNSTVAGASVSATADPRRPSINTPSGPSASVNSLNSKEVHQLATSPAVKMEPPATQQPGARPYDGPLGEWFGTSSSVPLQQQSALPPPYGYNVTPQQPNGVPVPPPQSQRSFPPPGPGHP